ncbi:MAG TPA: CBS domain-containing protein [Rhodocyclaceae bacterium]|nr:CBS domain-containing protein [Rhodocyclaceae bacterium]
MFSIYGLDGRVFYGPLEDLRNVRPVDQVFRVAPLDPDAPSTGQWLSSTEDAEAANARRLQQSYGDLERGPLYLAAQIMQRPVVTTRESEPVEHAWRLLRDRRIHQAPVLDAGGRLVGIVSERDLLTAINIDDGRVLAVLQRQVKDVMTSPVVAAVPISGVSLRPCSCKASMVCLSSMRARRWSASSRAAIFCAPWCPILP